VQILTPEKVFGIAVFILVISMLFAGLFVVLKQQVIPVREQYQSLRYRYERLEKEYSSLADRLFKLQQSHQRLEEKYRELNASYATLMEEKAELEAGMASLRKLLERYQRIYAEYLILKGRASAIIGREIRGGEDVQRILRMPPTKDVLEVVSELGLRRGMNSSEKARRVMEWLTLNTQALSDDYIVVVRNQSVTRLPEHILAPNETLKRGGGDCEDLAILAYALLKQALREDEDLYIITWTTGYFGHTAVLYGSRGRYIILDPAAGYATNSTIMMTIYFKNVTLTITPIGLEPGFKKNLVECGLAEIEYRPEGAKPYIFLDLNTTITLWINLWSGGRREPSSGSEHIYVDRIISDAVDRRFRSTEEFLAWMAARG